MSNNKLIRVEYSYSYLNDLIASVHRACCSENSTSAGEVGIYYAELLEQAAKQIRIANEDEKEVEPETSPGSLTEIEWLSCDNIGAMFNHLVYLYGNENNVYSCFFDKLTAWALSFWELAEVTTYTKWNNNEANANYVHSSNSMRARTEYLFWKDALLSRNKEYMLQACDIFREIFGNPFNPLSTNPRHHKFSDCKCTKAHLQNCRSKNAADNPDWLTDDVIDFARYIREKEQWHLMPTLSNMMTERGCDRNELLEHLCHREKCKCGGLICCDKCTLYEGFIPFEPLRHNKYCWALRAIIGSYM